MQSVAFYIVTSSIAFGLAAMCEALLSSSFYIVSGADTPSNSKPLRKTCCTFIESNKRACERAIFCSSIILYYPSYTNHGITLRVLSNSYPLGVVHSYLQHEAQFQDRLQVWQEFQFQRQELIRSHRNQLLCYDQN